MTTRVLAIADEVVDWLATDAIRAQRIDLVLAAGDLPFDYLRDIANVLDCPCVLVPGNHDPELSGFAQRHGLSLRGGFPNAWPGPEGWSDVDAAVHTVAGLRIAGLGGSIDYNGGVNQYTERTQARRVRSLVRQARRLGGVDVLLTHAPPLGVGDRDDPAHRGFACLHDAVRRLRPSLLLHGHIHPYAEPVVDHDLAGTTVCNVVGHRILSVPSPERHCDAS